MAPMALYDNMQTNKGSAPAGNLCRTIVCLELLSMIGMRETPAYLRRSRHDTSRRYVELGIAFA